MNSSQPIQPVQSVQPTCLVTGAAGFIGSHLSETLVARGYQVIGVDAFVDFYARALKEANLVTLRSEPLFKFIEADLRTADLTQLLESVDYVFHQAAQAGVRTSWGEGFTSYVEHNILVTQRLLEAAKTSKVRRVIYASSSSVYGNGSTQPAHEADSVLPISPYGVTKLAGEYLCRLYTKEFDLPTISLRYFTVYGPRQRPDMAFHKFICALLQGEPITIYGNGEQSRDFTYVSDIVEANIAAMRQGLPGKCYNIGGGERVTVNDVLRMLEQITGKRAYVHYIARQHGDAAHTASNTEAARAELGYNPRFNLADGLSREVRWVAEQLEPVAQLV